MNLLEQAKANLTDSTITTILGGGILVLGVLCDAGVLKLYLDPVTSDAWCSAIGKLATYVGGPALMVSRSPTTPPR
jgi:hypothetical protein